MILILTESTPLESRLRHVLETHALSYQILNPNEPKAIELLEAPEVKAAIVDLHFKNVSSLTHKKLSTLGNRIPVIAINGGLRHEKKTAPQQQLDFGENVTVLLDANIHSILATLQACGLFENKGIWSGAIAYYNPHVATNMLQKNGCLGVLNIDASVFHKIEVEYGFEVYCEIREVFQQILANLPGKSGCVRSEDILCRRSDQTNAYLVFLQRSRTTGTLPLPGMLEHIADRLSRVIQDTLWQDITSPAKQRKLPACIQSVPNIVVGFAGVISNPCLDPHELVNSVIQHSSQSLPTQSQRLKERQKEMMQTLIMSKGLLVPNYQGVFHLKDCTKKKVEEANKTKSFKPLVPHLYGFESLVRVKNELVENLVGKDRLVINPNILRPDVLFSIAKNANMALELDQACLQGAITAGADLPGHLMINILPRNLYFVDYLQEIVEKRKNIIFEISESESINNFSLVNQALEKLKPYKIQLAADDFGRGYAGLDRIIKIRPALIKFDRSLIQDIHKDNVKRAYVSGLVQAARLLKTSVLAEGVELWEEAKVLQNMGVDLVQGFLFHRPQPLEKVREQLGSGKGLNQAA